MQMRTLYLVPLIAVLVACGGKAALDPAAKHMDVQVPRAHDAQERPKHMDVQVPRAHDAQERPKHMDVQVPRAHDAQEQAKHRAEADAWFADRIARLTQPDGWLSLVGMHWLEPGTQTLGHGEDNALVLAVGPAHLGNISLADGAVQFVPADGVAFTIDGKPGSGSVALIPDSKGEPTVLGFADGRASLVLIERSGRMALRVRDAQAPTRTGFKGITRYPVDIGWRFDARFEPHPPGRTIPIASVINTLDDMVNPGVVVFRKDGKEHRLEAVDEGDGRLFLIFGDRTNGRETYGAGRFLYAGPVDANGHTVVDFNQAYNPPCALNAYSTCPLPPPENRLDLAIAAGELKVAGPGHE